VQIPALNRDYLGYLNKKAADPPSEKGLRLITLFVDQYFPAGRDMPAAKVLQMLVGEAKSLDGTPR
jgi:hypothetical protein